MEQFLKQQQEHLSKYGFYCHYVIVDSSTVDCHTHGLPDSFDHPDLQIKVAIPEDLAFTLLHDMVSWIKEGNQVEVNRPYSFLLNGMDVMFTWAVECDRDVLRLILPDREGRLTKSEISEPYSKQWLDTSGKRVGLGFR